jgi:hypothetical protein
MAAERHPILKVRTIDSEGEGKKPREFWNSIEERYPVYEGEDYAEEERIFKPILDLQQAVIKKLLQFPNFLSVIYDINEPGVDANKISTAGFPDNMGEEMKRLMQKHSTLRLIRDYNPNVKISFINLQESGAFNIDASLSPQGNALILAGGHVMFLAKQDGFYYFYDPEGTCRDSSFSKKCSIVEFLEKQIPEGSEGGIHATNTCKFQKKRGVCFLWCVLYLFYPELTDGKLAKIIDSVAESYAHTITTNEKGEEDWKFSQADKDHFYENLDIYVIALMEDFVASDQESYKAMSAEEYSEARLTKGGKRRRTRRRRRTNNKKTRNK